MARLLGCLAYLCVILAVGDTIITNTATTVAELKQRMFTLTRQLQLQQFNEEEKVRSDGNSGIKQIRTRNIGAENYFSNTHSGSSFAGIHDHSNNIRTVGMGEFVGVLNGVEFRQRHNKYTLVRRTTSGDYDETEHIKYPAVPPSVTAQKTVSGQITEMWQYFKAFNQQDTSIRDYRSYFKPVVCYLEGGWTTDKTSTDVDRPTKITNITADGEPVIALWNDRILCHPIKTKLGLEDFSIVDDFELLRIWGPTFGGLFDDETKAARFNLAPGQSSGYDPEQGFGKADDKPYFHGRLDKIMEEIPGKEKHQGSLNDKDLGISKYDQNSKPLNTAMYHRSFKTPNKETGKLEDQRIDFSDTSMFVARTTNPEIAKTNTKHCEINGGMTECRYIESRNTYAFPLEIIWLNPLHEWNPYNLEANDGEYYRTPAEFYSEHVDATDVTDSTGTVHSMSGSGIRIFTPEIPGVGALRMRYPIMPVHQEGNAIYKTLKALQNITMDMLKRQPIL